MGKYGSFNTNALLGRPYYCTYELLDSSDHKPATGLRIVPASELHAENLAEEQPTPAESRDEPLTGHDAIPGFDVVTENGQVLIRNNRLTIDDATRQALTMEEIEQLKKASTGSGKEIIEQIIKSHSALDEKTSFGLAKYTLRKSKKYMRRFTALPLNVSMLAKWMLEEKEPVRILELREEMLGLLASWSNVHWGGLDTPMEALSPNGRWLVVEDTGGLVVAALAERMGILHAVEPEFVGDDDDKRSNARQSDPNEAPEIRDPQTSVSPSQKQSSKFQSHRHNKPKHYPPDAMSATNNTITVIHPATQANLSLLSYFAYDPSDTSSKSTSTPSSEHPLHAHLKTVSFLQLADPTLDGSYTEPEVVTDATIATWKSSQRSNYYRKRRRWQQTKRVVDEARAGGFDGVVVASAMAPATVLHHVVPLLKGGAPVVVYSPSVEALAELVDLYSTNRKTAFMAGQGDDDLPTVPSEDFPVDPRLLLAPTLQTARAKQWQVLPGRSHPLMTGRGGAEGYLFTATRVIPAEGKVEARGRFSKKRKVDNDGIHDEKTIFVTAQDDKMGNDV